LNKEVKWLLGAAAKQPRKSLRNETTSGILEGLRVQCRSGSSTRWRAFGRKSGARFRCYERLRAYAGTTQDTIFGSPELLKAIDKIYCHPLRPLATDKLNRQLRSGISDIQLAELVLTLREEDRLCIVEESEHANEPRIICSMGMSSADEE
jgi:hypothetical protein